ncbi:MAG: toxin-antitoxin system HicB family antitoxin [Anaerosomatales bacterium]|nr:toxin-antitoxin system HicB family antitoxin [Anaerosomatales bacterium]
MARGADKKHAFEEYVFQVRVDEDGDYYLSIPRLPGCVSAGESIDEAVENLREAFADWTAHVEAQGHEIPAPIDEADYSGKVVLRMPKWLHAEAVARAEEAGVSLNTLLVAFISKSLGGTLATSAEETLRALQRQIAALQTGMSDVRSGVSAIASAVSAAAPVAHGKVWRYEAGRKGLKMEFIYSPTAHCLEEAAPGYLVPCVQLQGEAR